MKKAIEVVITYEAGRYRLEKRASDGEISVVYIADDYVNREPMLDKITELLEQ